jgi:hypothetical protein
MKTKDKSFAGENAKFPADVIIESLHKLAVEDVNRLMVIVKTLGNLNKLINFLFCFKIHENNGVRLLLDILKSLSVLKKEKHAAANAIWMLCYNEKIKKYVKDQNDAYQVIVKLAEASVHDDIRVSCKGILMLLNDEIEKKAEEYKKKKTYSEDSKRLTAKPLLNRQKEVEESEPTIGHIMISYNKFSREVCMKIKEKLDHHFDTWMDVNCIYGDALDSMADAVEKASVVLICMTENYKESANCAIGMLFLLFWLLLLNPVDSFYFRSKIYYGFKETICSFKVTIEVSTTWMVGNVVKL